MTNAANLLVPQALYSQPQPDYQVDFSDDFSVAIYTEIDDIVFYMDAE